MNVLNSNCLLIIYLYDYCITIILELKDNKKIKSPWCLSGKESTSMPETTCKAGHTGSTPGFSLWVRKILWRRKWQHPVFLLRKTYGQRSLACYSPRCLKNLT